MYSSVTGSNLNEANQIGSDVSDGRGNIASSGRYCSFSGDESNTASVYCSLVSAGDGNEASGSTILFRGGYINTAKGLDSVVIEGTFNSATDIYSLADAVLYFPLVTMIVYASTLLL